MLVKTKIITKLGTIEDDYKSYTKAKYHEWLGFIENVCKKESDYLRIESGEDTFILPGELLRNSVIEIKTMEEDKNNV